MKQNLLAIIILTVIHLSLAAQNDSRIASQVIVQLFPKAEIADLIQQASTNNYYLEIINPVSTRLNIWLLKYKVISTDIDIISLLKRHSDVANVQFNHTLQNRTIPTDPSFNLQWNMVNEASGGVDDADIDADEAWNCL